MKTTFQILLSLFFFLGAAVSSYGQAAIAALIFGDKVANENFYLRIDAGANFTTLPGLSGAETRTAFIMVWVLISK